MKGYRCNSIILEGQDLLGKSLQTRRLAQHFESLGLRVAQIKSPYNDSFSFKLIYWMLGNGLARKCPNLFQFIHFYNKFFFELFILPSILKNNDVIIFDRWSISMWAYGVTDGASETLTRWMLNCISEPDYTILLDGLRFTREQTNDSYESDTKYQSKVRSMYLSWALSHDCMHVSIVNANQSIEDVTKDIISKLKQKGIIS